MAGNERTALPVFHFPLNTFCRVFDVALVTSILRQRAGAVRLSGILKWKEMSTAGKPRPEWKFIIQITQCLLQMTRDRAAIIPARGVCMCLCISELSSDQKMPVHSSRQEARVTSQLFTMVAKFLMTWALPTSAGSSLHRAFLLASHKQISFSSTDMLCFLSLLGLEGFVLLIP